MKTVKRLIGVMLGVCLMIMATGCGNSEEMATKKGYTTITMWSSNAHSKHVMEDLVREFNQTIGEKEKINFVYEVRENNLSQQMELAITTGQAPDFLSGDMAKLAENGDIIAINDIEGGQEYLDSEFEGFVFKDTIHSYKGKVYRVPSNSYLFGLIYNKDMFKKAGLVDEKGEAKPPVTWDEFREYAKILTNKSKKEFGTIFPVKWSAWLQSDVVLSSMQNYGTIGWDPVKGEYDRTVFAPTMEAFVGIKNDGSCYPGSEGIENDPARARFAEGTIGMKFAASYDVAVLNDQFPAKCDWGVAPLPVISEEGAYKQARNYGMGAFISKKAVEEKGADKILTVYKWLYGDEVNTALYKAGCDIPWKQEIIDNNKNLKDAPKGWEEFASLAAISEYPAYGPSVKIEGYEGTRTVFLQQVWNGKAENILPMLEKENKLYNDGIKAYVKLHPEYDPDTTKIPDWNVKR